VSLGTFGSAEEQTVLNPQRGFFSLWSAFAWLRWGALPRPSPKLKSGMVRSGESIILSGFGGVCHTYKHLLKIFGSKRQCDRVGCCLEGQFDNAPTVNGGRSRHARYFECVICHDASHLRDRWVAIVAQVLWPFDLNRNGADKEAKAAIKTCSGGVQ
jgi:hypothetical protein